MPHCCTFELCMAKFGNQNVMLSQYVMLSHLTLLLFCEQSCLQHSPKYMYIQACAIVHFMVLGHPPLAGLASTNL